MIDHSTIAIIMFVLGIAAANIFPLFKRDLIRAKHYCEVLNWAEFTDPPLLAEDATDCLRFEFPSTPYSIRWDEDMSEFAVAKGENFI